MTVQDIFAFFRVCEYVQLSIWKCFLKILWNMQFSSWQDLECGVVLVLAQGGQIFCGPDHDSETRIPHDAFLEYKTNWPEPYPTPSSLTSVFVKDRHPCPFTEIFRLFGCSTLLKYSAWCCAVLITVYLRISCPKLVSPKLFQRNSYPRQVWH